MSADTATQPINTANAVQDGDPSPLTKVDSAVQGLSSSPTEEKTTKHRRTSSSAPGVWNINDLGMDFSFLSPSFPCILVTLSSSSFIKQILMS